MTDLPRFIRENAPLAPLTYYKIGGPARYLAEPRDTSELAQTAAFLRETRLPYCVLGAGSNTLFDDRGVAGVVVRTMSLGLFLRRHGNELATGAGVPVIQLLRLCMKDGIAGLEFLAGVPGNMGGVLFMNAGTKLGEVAEATLEVNAYDLAAGTERAIRGAELRYSYRKQHFLGNHEIILGGRLKGRVSDPESVQAAIQALLSERKRSQPIEKPSCGSVFRNPDPSHGLHAWKLIDEAGLRGHRIGDAQISEKHANFIVNLGGASAKDVLALIHEAKRGVREKTGIELEEEVRIVPYEPASRL